ncbi:MAG: NAD-dependent epimerase/dehydratase family protein [Acidobacteria bacterium]|jgi:nucleoside-diphosphate-sugar epimerase|nr:NAD-dependent epimerase/dehydratase family protein [Acidobacteriota bacterium]
MNILVTGGTGFVGRHLIAALEEGGGNRLHALVRDSHRFAASSFSAAVAPLRGDLFTSEPFPEDIDTVFHLAAVTKAATPGEFRRVNVEGTRALLEKLKPLKKLQRVVLLSSLAAAGPTRGNDPLREDMTAAPISLYGRSKLAQEEMVATHCPAPYVILRAPIVFGPGDMDMLDAFRFAARGIMPLLGRRARRYSLIYVKDLARAMVAVAFGPCRNEIFYAANPDAVEWRELLEQAARLLGRGKTRKIVIPEALGRILAEFSEQRMRILGKKAIFNRDKFSEMKHPVWVCSAAKIEAMLHFQPRFPLLAALQETIGWYREQGFL